MNTLRNFLWVGLGGGIGAMLRFLILVIFKSNPFPVYTMLINITGSLCIGMIFAATAKNDHFADHVKFFLATGLCGGFTTFSAFSLENMQLIRSGNYLTSIIYILASVCGCIIAAFAGFKLING